MSQTILIVDDEPTLRFALVDTLKREGYTLLQAEDGKQGLEMLKSEAPDLVFLDMRMPEMTGMEVLGKARQAGFDGQAVFLTAYGEIEDAVEAMRLDAYDFLTKPPKLDKIRLIARNALESGCLRKTNRSLVKKQDREDPFAGFIGESAQMKKLFSQILKIGDSQATTVLVQGESGAGKELVARAIHRASSSASGPVVEINCGAIPETLLESELFGYEKGAFTDAKNRKKGLIEAAGGGTLFLDEIGEMGLQLQTRLLRVLENRTFRRVGGIEDLKVNARIVAATNKDLKKESEEGRFRQDLYFRLGIIVLEIPPLRERPEDLSLLADFFIERFNQELGRSMKPLSEPVLKVLREYSWPGNIRELRNMFERILLLEDGNDILIEHLPREIREDPGFPDPGDGKFRPETVAAVELRHIRRTLEYTGGNKSRAAGILGISRQTLREKLKQGEEAGEVSVEETG
ncbi:MAG: sigma-54 dependent transcriptional regulator [Candidatus Krumholzibacteria bacterium]|nr:sigma-54 dependent transcriptional regulator [Candidatus Krumholzibacteria bacterium]MDP6796303.1 sigma-54 dependent transcriptional regulator [Candidatus Krumholzibacteria bacterium]MDP7020964.1 sigma-54 dependent transcriptional regulator [Candidatus Krumholzibacteria bacterium]